MIRVIDGPISYQPCGFALTVCVGVNQASNCMGCDWGPEAVSSLTSFLTSVARCPYGRALQFIQYFQTVSGEPKGQTVGPRSHCDISISNTQTIDCRAQRAGPPDL